MLFPVVCVCVWGGGELTLAGTRHFAIFDAMGGGVLVRLFLLVSELIVLLSGKGQRISVEEYWRLVVRFLFNLCQYLTQL